MNTATVKFPLRSASRVMLFYVILSLCWFFFTTYLLPEHSIEPFVSNNMGLWVTLSTIVTGGVVSAYIILVWRQHILHHQRQMAIQVAEKDRLLHHFFDLPLLGMAITRNLKGDWLRFNDHLCTLFRITRSELQNLNLMALTHPDDRALDIIEWEKMLGGQSNGYRREKRFVLRDGSLMFALIDNRCVRAPDGSIDCVISVIEDITARKNSELYLIRQNNLYDMLSQTNQAIVRSQDRFTLLDSICRTAVKHGGFIFACINLNQAPQSKKHILTSYGHDNGFIQFVETYRDRIWAETSEQPRFLLPSDRVFNRGSHIVINNFINDESVRPLHDAALQAGFQSAGYFAIKEQNQIIGTLNLYADESEFFSLDVLSTLNDMMMDVTYALDMLCQKQEKETALLALQNASEVIDASPTVLFRWKPNSRWEMEYVSSNVSRWGYQADDFIHGKLSMSDLLHPDDLHRIWGEVIRHIESRHREYILECRIKTADGQYLWVENHVTTSFDRKGKPVSFTGVMTDITLQKANEIQLRQAATVFESTREGIIIMDQHFHMLKVNRAMIDLFGYEESEVLGKTPELFFAPEHNKISTKDLKHSIQTHDFWRGEVWNLHKNGTSIPIMASLTPVRDDNGSLLYYIGVYSDISQLKDSEARLEHMALHDPLTGLPNRAMLNQKLAIALDEAIRNKHRLALLMLDLDHFKNVNDSFGHHYGDELLHAVARRLKEQLRQTDVVCRLGGDEFTILMQNNPAIDDVSILASKLIHTLHQPFTLSNDRTVTIGTSIGISLYPEHGTTVENLMQQADTAMYRAKQEGRDGFRYFSEELYQRAKARLELEQRLHRAITGEEFQIFYQPQIELKTNRVIGAEALLRWNDPDLGLIQPSQFISVAEETGLIQNIGEWTLFEACRQGKEWIDKGLPSLNLAVNLSPLQLHHDDIQSSIERILKNTGFPASRLELELTESALMEQQEEAVEILQALRLQGIRIAIDDFGTGYSSLAYLKQFPLDVLKIDKRFVDDIPLERDDMEIAATIVAMGHTLRLTVLAEGVENQAQLDFLTEQGCDYYQGYLCSAPLPADAFEQFIRDRNQSDKKSTQSKDNA